MKTVEGITIDKSHNGLPMFAHIDLRKHSDLIPILENKGGTCSTGYALFPQGVRNIRKYSIK